MITTIDRPARNGDRNLQEPDEIDLTNLDYRTLTPEQWTLLKAQVVRRARVEQAKACIGWL